MCGGREKAHLKSKSNKGGKGSTALLPSKALFRDILKKVLEELA